MKRNQEEGRKSGIKVDLTLASLLLVAGIVGVGVAYYILHP